MDFHIATDEVYANYVQEISPKYQSISQSELLKTYPFEFNKLYICKTVDDSFIRILADFGVTYDADGKAVMEA